MTHITSLTWKPEQTEHLRKLVAKGVPPVRASAIFKRSPDAVKLHAKVSGFPFPDSRDAVTERRRKEAAVRKFLGLPAQD
jgi:hypothetical protein